MAESTIATYGHHVKAYLAFLKEEGCAASEATSDHVAAHIGGLRARGLRSTPIFCATAAIKSFHRFMLAKGRAAQDPSAGQKSPKITSRVPEPLSEDEVECLLAAVPGHGLTFLRDRAIIELLYHGLRLGEAMGMDVADIHPAKGYARILGKGSRERLVPVGGKATEALGKYLAARASRFGASGALFVSRRGTRLGKSTFQRRFKRYAARAGITRRVYPHLLRHSFALHLLARRADMRSLQLLLGHSSLSTTQRYLQLDFNALRETCLRAHPRF